MDSLDQKKYKYVKNILSSNMVDFLTSFSLKKNSRVDDEVPLAFGLHSADSEIYYHTLQYLLPIMEKETNLKLKPIYSFNRIYFGGAELVRHKDRDECEISASITLQYSYEDKSYKWPLCMGDIPIVIETGDGVIYKGREIEHWRPVFTQFNKSWHHQLFVHYVDLNGSFKDLKEEVF